MVIASNVASHGHRLHVDGSVATEHGAKVGDILPVAVPERAPITRSGWYPPGWRGLAGLRTRAYGGGGLRSASPGVRTCGLGRPAMGDSGHRPG
jgi:hypothetical protein